jgi:hypothetical protein
VIVTKETVRNETVSTAVHNKETLGNGGANQNIVNVRVGEEEAYGKGKYPVVMTVVRGASSTITYGCPRGDEGKGRQP